MKERLKRWAPKLLYPVFYLVCLVIFFSWTFPYDKLRDRIVAQFNAQQRTSAAPQTLEIDELDSSFVTGVKATGIRLVSPATEAGKPPVTLTIDSAKARVSLLGLIVGNKDVSFKVEAFDGTIKGSFEDSSKERKVEVELDGVDTARIEPIAANLGFPLDGKLFGTISLQLPEGKASKGNGTVNIELRDLYAGNTKELAVKTPMGPFTLPRLKVGTFTITGDAKDGMLKLTKIVTAAGGDVDVQGEGRVQLREVASDAHIDANLKFKINDAYRKKNDKTKLLFGDPAIKEPTAKDKPLLDMNPQMAKAKTVDGYYQMHVTGTLAKPEFAPTGSAGASVGGSGSGLGSGSGSGLSPRTRPGFGGPGGRGKGRGGSAGAGDGEDKDSE